VQGAAAGVNVVVVSGDKDFQQLIRPNVWLLNPGRGGPASVEENWVSVENGNERLGVPPVHVVDYLALVGDTSDNVPGVKGIGEKTAQELVNSFGTIENILAHATEITKKRPREALLEQGDMAMLSKELVTIRCDLPITLDLEAMRMATPDYNRLRPLYVELEFHTLAKNLPAGGSDIPGGVDASAAEPIQTPTKRNYTLVDTPEAVEDAVAAARRAPYISIEPATIIDPSAPHDQDPLRSTLGRPGDRGWSWRRRSTFHSPIASASKNRNKQTSASAASWSSMLRRRKHARRKSPSQRALLPEHWRTRRRRSRTSRTSRALPCIRCASCSKMRA
jgi:DNA polymerase-1